MDRNLMSLIVANFSLSQPTYTLIINALVGLLSALIGAGVVLYAAQRSHKHEEMMASQETAKEERQKRRNLFGQLFSERKGLTQLYFSRFEATIHSQVHESAQKILKKQNGLKEDIDRNIAEQSYWKHRGNELLEKLALEEMRLSEITGLISVSFPETQELTRLINQLNEIKTLKPPYQPDFEDLTALEAWKTDTLLRLDIKVKQEYLTPINDLIVFLKPLVEDNA
jgi:hypothetical protein